MLHVAGFNIPRILSDIYYNLTVCIIYIMFVGGGSRQDSDVVRSGVQPPNNTQCSLRSQEQGPPQPSCTKSETMGRPC